MTNQRQPNNFSTGHLKVYVAVEGKVNTAWRSQNRPPGPLESRPAVVQASASRAGTTDQVWLSTWLQRSAVLLGLSCDGQCDDTAIVQSCTHDNNAELLTGSPRGRTQPATCKGLLQPACDDFEEEQP